MKKYVSILVIILLLLFSFFMPHLVTAKELLFNQTAVYQDAPISSNVNLTVKIKEEKINSEKQIEFEITIKNEYSDSIYLKAEILDNLLGYEIEIKNAEEMIIPLEKKQESNNGISSFIGMEIASGEELTQKIQINQLYKLPVGDYSIKVYRYFAIKGEKGRKMVFQTKSEPFVIKLEKAGEGPHHIAINDPTTGF